MERVEQGGHFVAELLDRVTGLLLKSLQEQLAGSALLRADLGFPDVFPVPVCTQVLPHSGTLLMSGGPGKISLNLLMQIAGARLPGKGALCRWQ